jgi:chorismate mutase
MAVRAVRGATTVDADDVDEIRAHVGEMLAAIVERNEIADDDLISCFFTATSDITAMFPATAARDFGWHDVPLLGAVELAVADTTPRCIRVLVHVASSRSRSEIQHVYLRDAVDLRNDVPGG